MEKALTKAELAELQRKLSTMSVTAIRDFYFAAHVRCRLEGDKVPAARSIQELVQAWKEVRKWHGGRGS
jgi:hypothetical protein